MTGILFQAGEIQKGAYGRIRVALKEFKGKRFVDLREHVIGDDGRWVPTKKGVTIAPEDLPRLAEAVNRLLEHGLSGLSHARQTELREDTGEDHG